MRAVADQATVFVGAGLAAEAGLPPAEELAEELIRVLVRPEWAANELVTLSRVPAPEAAEGREVLRPELLLLWVADVFDDDLRFFASLDDAVTPADAHRRLATTAVQGARLITTNVDDLLERAVADAGGVAHTVDCSRDTTVPADAVGVFKLRGSRYVHLDGRRRRSPRPPRLTLDAITAAGPGTPGARGVESVLAAALTGRDLVICGSTATDELDAVPALAASRPRSVIWIEAHGRPVEVVDPARATGRCQALARLVRAWHEAGVPVTAVRGPLPEALDSVGLGAAPAPTASPTLGVPDWREQVRSWAERVRDEDPTGLGLAALLLGELGRFDSAERALAASVPSSQTGAGWSKARLLYERAQMALLHPDGDPEQALRLGVDALAAAEADPAAGMTINCRMVLGRAALALRRWDGSLDHFEAALALSPQGSHDRGVALSWTGRARLWSGDPLGARPPLRRAVLLLRLVGEQEGLIDALQALGIAESTLGQHLVAVRLFAEARDIARRLDFPDQQFAATQALADCHFARGDLAAARRALETLLGKDGLDDRDEAALAWGLLAAVDLERGDLEAAERAAQQALDRVTVWTKDESGEAWALLAEVAFLRGDEQAARHAAAQALAQPEDQATWWSRTRAEAVLAAITGVTRPLATRLAPQVRLLTGPPLLVAAASMHRLGIDTAQSRRLRERARRYAQRIGADHWLS